MFWLLAIPLIGAVVAAVSNSDDEEAKKQAQRESTQRHKAKVAAARREVARDRDLQERRRQVRDDAALQLAQALAAHPAVVRAPGSALPAVDFAVLETFARHPLAREPAPLMKQLVPLVPDVAFSPVWVEQGKRIRALRAEIKALESFKNDLVG